MNLTSQLRSLGQSIWLDNITRDLLTNGTLSRYIRDFGVTGLTSNPSIFDQAIGNSDSYDEAILQKARAGKSGEALFFELAIEDLAQAAGLFRPIYDETDGIDGWVSLEVSPLLAADTTATVEAAKRLHASAQRPNLLIKIPGTPEGLPAIEESIFAGIPVNVTLLFSPAHYLAAAEAYMRGIERRIKEGLDPCVTSVASIFVSRWDVAANRRVPARLHNRLGIAIGQSTYQAYRELLRSRRWHGLKLAGARQQRLLWASTGTKAPNASDTLYIEALAAPDTIDTMPEKTLLAFAEHGVLNGALVGDGQAAAVELNQFREAGIDIDALALQLQQEGAKSFVQAWHRLLQRIAEKSVGHSPALPGLSA